MLIMHHHLTMHQHLTYRHRSKYPDDDDYVAALYSHPTMASVVTVAAKEVPINQVTVN